MPWVLFVVSVVVIVVAGTMLARYADQIAELTGLGSLWVGVVLVAGATSLPPFFSELPKCFFNSLLESRGRTRCCRDFFEQQTPRVRCSAPAQLADCGYMSLSSHSEHAEWCETSGSLKPVGRGEQGIALAALELCIPAGVSFT